jgi:hypothetical protein
MTKTYISMMMIWKAGTWIIKMIAATATIKLVASASTNKSLFTSILAIFNLRLHLRSNAILSLVYHLSLPYPLCSFTLLIYVDECFSQKNGNFQREDSQSRTKGTTYIQKYNQNCKPRQNSSPLPVNTHKHFT